MNVLCAHTNLRDETREAVTRLWPHVELVDVTHSTTGYHEALDERWQAGCDLVNIEHDIVPHDGVPAAFADCPEPWCVFLYELAVGFIPALGCARFRAELLAAEPDAIQSAGETDNTGVPANAWWRIDVRLDRHLRDRGYTPHIHEPPVVHLNERQKLHPEYR